MFKYFFPICSFPLSGRVNSYRFIPHAVARIEEILNIIFPRFHAVKQFNHEHIYCAQIRRSPSRKEIEKTQTKLLSALEQFTQKVKVYNPSFNKKLMQKHLRSNSAAGEREH